MIATSVEILRTGLVTSVGLDAPSSCAAIRAGIVNPTETRFMGSSGEWIRAHQVSLDGPWRGLSKLAKMAAMAAEECLCEMPPSQWTLVPCILCVAESDRPGRLKGLDKKLLPLVERELGAAFSPNSLTLPLGRVSVCAAIVQARRLLESQAARHVLIVATDSLILWPTLNAYERAERLLSPQNSNGFMPGEGAGSLLVGLAEPASSLVCSGAGLARETAHIDSNLPLRGDGLVSAISHALSEANCELHDIDFRVTDISGEQYYFKEAALAVTRLLRELKRGFDIWHPAECIGECGAVAGAATVAVAAAACRKLYARGRNVLLHAANDSGARAALIVRHLVV